MKCDNVVIGSGVSGMTTALLLAKEGRQTILLEASPQMAPTISGFCKNNIYFDTGFHYSPLLGEGQALSTLFDHLDLKSHLKMVLHPHSLPDRFLCSSENVNIPMQQGLEAFTEQLLEMYPGEKKGILEYLGEIQGFLDALNDNAFSTLLENIPLSNADEATLQDYLNNNFSSPVLKTLFSLHCLLYGSLPNETPLSFHAMVAGGYYDSTWQIIGGGQAITRAYEQVLKDNQVDIHLSSLVEKIELDHTGKVQSVILDNGNIIECSNCIYSGDLSRLSGLLPEKCFRPIYHKRLDDLKNTLSAIVIYCRESHRPDKSNDFGNLILTHELFPEMFQLESDVDKRPMFISRSLSDSHESGLSIIYPCNFSDVARWENSTLGQRPDDYITWKHQTAEKVIAIINEHCGDFLGDLSVVDVATPLTFRDYMHASEGCLYGVKHQASGMPFLPQTKVKGLYITGQAIISPGIIGAIKSGYLCATAVTNVNYDKKI